MTRLTLDGFALRFPRTGVVTYIYNILGELLRRADYDIVVLLGDNNFADADIKEFMLNHVQTRGVEYIEETNPLKKLVAILETKKLAARLPSASEVASAVAPGDIYHATDWYHYAAPHARFNLLTYHDLTAKLFPQFHEFTNIVKEKRKARAIKTYDRIVAVSDSTKNDLINYMSVSSEKIEVIHLGADPVYEKGVRTPRETLLKKYTIDSSVRYILSVSTIEPRKNIIGTLNAYKILLSSNPVYRDVRLVLAGPAGWRGETLKNYLTNYPFRDNVTFTGYVDLSDMPALYYNAEAFIFLSYYEGFGIPVLEAMKSLCPVVCSNTSSMPEVLGDCGELVSPNSPEEAAAALKKILDDSTYADSLRFAGYARSGRFSWNSHVDKLEKIYANG